MKTLYLVAALLGLAACASAPDPVPEPPSVKPPLTGAPSPAPVWSPPVPADFGTLPGWSEANLIPGINAFQKSCETFTRRNSGDLLSTSAPWAGRVRRGQKFAHLGPHPFARKGLYSSRKFGNCGERVGIQSGVRIAVPGMEAEEPQDA